VCVEDFRMCLVDLMYCERVRLRDEYSPLYLLTRPGRCLYNRMRSISYMYQDSGSYGCTYYLPCLVPVPLKPSKSHHRPYSPQSDMLCRPSYIHHTPQACQFGILHEISSAKPVTLSRQLKSSLTIDDVLERIPAELLITCTRPAILNRDSAAEHTGSGPERVA
jgi:hypothetical protein